MFCMSLLFFPWMEEWYFSFPHGKMLLSLWENIFIIFRIYRLSWPDFFLWLSCSYFELKRFCFCFVLIPQVLFQETPAPTKTLTQLREFTPACKYFFRFWDNCHHFIKILPTLECVQTKACSYQWFKASTPIRKRVADPRWYPHPLKVLPFSRSTPPCPVANGKSIVYQSSYSGLYSWINDALSEHLSKAAPLSWSFNSSFSDSIPGADNRKEQNKKPCHLFASRRSRFASISS